MINPLSLPKKWTFTFVTAIIGLLSGCGRQPETTGSIDYHVLGTGIGHELSETAKGGGRILLFGIPGAAGYAERLEADILKQIRAQLRPYSVEVQQVTYTADEIDLFQSRQLTSLNSDFAASALQRHDNGELIAAISLVGWPEGNLNFLPRNLHFIGVSWGSSPDPQTLASRLNRVSIIRARSGKRPSPAPVDSQEQTLVFFNQRFEIIRSTP